ncbi:MAG: efflux RND transporter permease subunit [Planctomycetes bacterium]|nr:efflux RND transporter permease subunit [Planctomycetota bacterium]
MNLPELCIRRPVFACMLLLFPVVAGLIAFARIGVDLMPNVDLPVVIVTTTRPGTSVEEMETGVTKVIEDAVNTISGIDELRSTSKEGISSVTIVFLLEKNRDIAQQEVQGKINTVLAALPTGTQAPIIDKFDFDAAPVLTVAVDGQRSLREVTEIARRQVQDVLSSVDGVGAVSLVGGQRRAVTITADAARLEAYGLSIDQVRQGLQGQNVESPGGRVDQAGREPILRTMGRITDPARFADVIVAQKAGQPVRIADIATVADGIEEPRSVGRLDGQNAVLLVVQKQSGTNTIDVIARVKARLAGIAEGFRKDGRTDLRFTLIRDQSVFISGSLHEIEKHLFLGALLVAGSILLFLRDWRTMIIASLSIPISLIASFMVMGWLGFTLNNITMLALVMAVGVVIDDAVVVNENIFRWMEEKGVSAWDAALGATREIALAVVATTLSLVVIFLPVAFMSGRVGRFFHSFGITMAVAILVSMLVSFVLTPMLASRFLKLKPAPPGGRADHHSGGLYGRWIERPYLAALRWALRRRALVMTMALAVALLLFPLPFGRWLAFGDAATQQRLAWLDFPGLAAIAGVDFVPTEDQSEFEIAITTPPGWTLERSDATFRALEARLRAQPEVVDLLTTIGDTSGRITKAAGEVTKGTIYVRLVDLLQRQPGADGRRFTQADLMTRARAIVAAWPDLRTSIQPASGGSGGVNADVEFALVGPDLERLGAYADAIVAKLRLRGDLSDVDTTLALRKPEIRVVIDRERASDQGVSVQAAARALGTLVGGEVVSDFKDARLGELYDVWLRARGPDRDGVPALEALTVPSTRGPPVRLASIATLTEARGPAQIDRYNRVRKISIVANLNGIPTSEAAAAFVAAGAAVGMPADYRLVAGGRAKVQVEANQGFLLAFGLSLVFMYMVLAAQFESFVMPIAILLAVPVTIPFALISLILLGQPLTIYSILGIFLLFGIVKKNGILQVDYANVLRARLRGEPGLLPAAYADPTGAGRWWAWVGRHDPAWRSRLWAVIEANRVRLRPILMTTLMLIASMVPIALGEGPGSGRRAAMARVIVGGQALSLLLSLLVTPVAYTLFDDLSAWWRRTFGGGGGAAGALTDQVPRAPTLDTAERSNAPLDPASTAATPTPALAAKE